MQKFGGTSVGKFAAKIAETIIPYVSVIFLQVNCMVSHKMSSRTYLDQHRVVIVCSARSGSTKALGTTNLLLRAASEVLKRNTPGGLQSPETPGTATPLSTSQVFGRPQAQDAFSQNSPPSSPIFNGRPRGNSSPHHNSSSSFSTFNPNSPLLPFNATVDLLKSEHITAAKQSINSPGLLREVICEIERDCEGLRAFLYAALVRNMHLSALRIDPASL